MKKPRHVVKRKDRYYYVPTPKMKEAGIAGEPLGKDQRAAYARAEELNALWDGMREDAPPSAGTFADIVSRFERDPAWYYDNPKTRDDADRAFKRIAEHFGNAPVSLLQRKHVRNFYNQMRVDLGVSVAAKAHKYLRRLFEYSVEIGLRDDNPALRMKIQQPKSREAVWFEGHIEKVIQDALTGGRADSGNRIPPRPSLALGICIAYDTGQRRGDIISLQWPQYDGEGLTVTQGKTGKRLWLPLSERTRNMLDGMERRSINILVSEATGKPYKGEEFSRLFRKFRKRAGIEGVHFHDIRRTVASELGNRGATSTEISSITGHSHRSKVIDVYVRPDREAAVRAFKKRTE